MTTKINGLMTNADLVSITDYGARLNGDHDDTDAWEAALADLKQGDSLYVPPGVSPITRPLSATNKWFSLVGAGQDAAVLLFDDCNGLVVDNSGLSDKRRVTLAGMTLQTAQSGLYQAITYTGLATSALRGQLTVAHCAFVGLSDGEAWKVPLQLNEASFAEVLYCYFKGDTNERDKMTSAIDLLDSTDVKLLGNYYYWADVAVNIRGFSEGIIVADSHFAPVNIGVRKAGSGNLVWVRDNHINAFVKGVDIGEPAVASNNHCHVHNNLIFKHPQSTSDFHGIHVKSKRHAISGNEVLIPGSAPAGGAQYGIVLSGDSGYCRVAGNHLADMDTGILLQSGTTDNTLVGNTFQNCTNRISDSGTKTVRVGNLGDNARRGVLVSLTAGASIADSTNTSIAWDTEQRDSDGLWDVGSPTRLTVPAGVDQVRLRAGLQWVSSSTGERFVEITKNGNTNVLGLPADRRAALANTATSLQSAIIDVSGGDYFELRVYQNSGAPLDAAGSGNSWFELELIG